MRRAVTVVVAPWVRTRLRAAPGAALALALLVAVTACLAAVFPRAVDRYEDAGLARTLRQAGPVHTTITVSAPQPDFAAPPGERAAALRPDTLKRQYEEVLDTASAPLPVDRAQSAYGVITRNRPPVPDPWIPRPSGLPAHVALVAQSGLAGHARVREGRLPRTSGPVTDSTPGVEAAVTADTASSLHIKVGSVIHVPGVDRPPLAVRITGVLTPRDPAGAYWSTNSLLRTPSLVTVPPPGPNPLQYWLGALLLPPDAAPALLGTAGDPARYWTLPPDLGGLRAHDLDRLKSAVAALESGPGLQHARTVTDPRADVDTGLDDALAGFSRLRSGISSLVAVAAAGTGTVAAVVLLMAGGLAADRRRAELALLRARGVSLRGLAGRLLAETAVVAVPAGALGLGAALALVPASRAGYAVAAALAVTVVACAALPARAALAHRAVRVAGGRREDVATVRPSRRRTVAELTLLVLAAGAVEALRRRGATGDQLISVAPVLVGVIAALVLLRAYPFLLRRLARPASRLRGAVAHLSLARAGRTSVSAVLPLLALLTALTTAAFGGSVLAGVHTTRDRAALLAVGADARVDSDVPLPAGLAARVRDVPGVREVSPVSIDYQAKPQDGPDSVALAAVDPAGYSRVATRTGLGGFPAGDLARRHGELPALASPSVAEAYGTRRPFLVRLADGSAVTVRITAVRDRTPALSGDFLVVDRAGLTRAAARPTTLLLTGGQVDAAALRRAAHGSGTVLVRAEERARYADSPLQTGAEHVYTAAVAAGAGYALLALLLSLLRAAPERTALLARLRTMGLSRAESRRLLILESLPQALLAGLGGALTGWATIRLLSPGIDLTTIAVATAQTPAGEATLRPDPWSLATPALLVLTLTVAVAASQAWWTARRGSARELRAGDGR